MVKIFLAIILLIFLFKIFRSKDVKKLQWFFAGILFFPQTILFIEKPTFPFHRIIILFFLISSLINTKNFWPAFKKFPLKNTFLIVFSCLLMIGLADTRVNIFQNGFRLFFTFLENFFLLFLVYFHVKTVSDAFKIYETLIIFFIVFTLYGLVNYVVGISDYNQIIAEAFNVMDFANRYNILGRERSRISSLAWHPIYYGFLLGLIIILNIFLLNKRKYSDPGKYFHILSLFLLITNLILTNSRTPLVATVLGIFIYSVFDFNLNKKFKFGLAGIIMFISIVNIMPSSFSLIEQTLNIFSEKGNKIEGSSLEMRNMQMTASLGLFYDSPIFGHGFNYISEGMGYSSGEDNKTDSSFAGFESYAYKLLIEQGSSGIFANVFLLIQILLFLFKNRKNKSSIARSCVYQSLGMVILFIVFILGTGDMGTFIPFMSVLGINLKLISILRKQEEYLIT